MGLFRSQVVLVRKLARTPTARLYAGHIEVYYKGHLVERIERIHGTGEARIDYRHVIGSLVRKPGAWDAAFSLQFLARNEHVLLVGRRWPP